MDSMKIAEERAKKLHGEWEYLYTVDSWKGKHRIKCVRCGKERTVKSLSNIAECVCIKRERKLQEREQEREQSKVRTCVVCGKEFVSARSTRMYCSHRCCDKAKAQKHSDVVRAKRSTHKRLREAKAIDNGKVDWGITLDKLIERDGGICALCGKPVNMHDYYVTEQGYFITGNDYPSVDHIVPLAKGGVHQWENVQLAHRYCNSLKADKL